MQYRDGTLRRYNWPDPYEKIKSTEDAAAIRLFPQVIAELDAHAMPERIEALIRGVFAGNIFDMGTAATVQHYQKYGMDFFGTRRTLPRRPWLSDTFDLLAARFADNLSPYKQVLFMVDNAGADLVLGCIPLARQMALWGSRVVIAANDQPSLNDVTLPELKRVLRELSERDSALRRLLRTDRIATVGTGNDAPLIDLSRISDECNCVARDERLHHHRRHGPRGRKQLRGPVHLRRPEDRPAQGRDGRAAARREDVRRRLPLRASRLKRQRQE